MGLLASKGETALHRALHQLARLRDYPGAGSVTNGCQRGLVLRQSKGKMTKQTLAGDSIKQEAWSDHFGEAIVRVRYVIFALTHLF